MRIQINLGKVLTTSLFVAGAVMWTKTMWAVITLVKDHESRLNKLEEKESEETK